ncbi:MAG: type II toxin-antitoxin system VapB family antitoxin [Dehalococcoidia bacterium]
MAPNIDDAEVERLIEKLAAITGETPRDVIRTALADRLARIEEQARRRRQIDEYLSYLTHELWPNLPPGELGRVLTREEEDNILGYGSHGG